MRKYLKRLTKTQLLILFFIPFGVGSFYFNGLTGLIGAIIGWWLGSVIWKNQKAILNYDYKKFFRKYRVVLLSLLILIPVDVLAYKFGGCKIFAAVTIGWLLGILTWRLRKGRW